LQHGLRRVRRTFLLARRTRRLSRRPLRLLKRVRTLHFEYLQSRVTNLHRLIDFFPLLTILHTFLGFFIVVQVRKHFEQMIPFFLRVLHFRALPLPLQTFFVLIPNLHRIARETLRVRRMTLLKHRPNRLRPRLAFLRKRIRITRRRRRRDPRPRRLRWCRR